MQLTNIPFVNKKYKIFYEKKGFIPLIFNPYNLTELDKNGYSPTMSTQCGSVTSSATILMIVEVEDD